MGNILFLKIIPSSVLKKMALFTIYVVYIPTSILFALIKCRLWILIFSIQPKFVHNYFWNINIKRMIFNYAVLFKL